MNVQSRIVLWTMTFPPQESVDGGNHAEEEENGIFLLAAVNLVERSICYGKKSSELDKPSICKNHK